jgi:hypothetical protein
MYKITKIKCKNVFDNFEVEIGIQIQTNEIDTGGNRHSTVFGSFNAIDT